jgi:hypothetical protein
MCKFAQSMLGIVVAFTTITTCYAGSPRSEAYGVCMRNTLVSDCYDMCTTAHPGSVQRGGHAHDCWMAHCDPIITECETAIARAMAPYMQ